MCHKNRTDYVLLTDIHRAGRVARQHIGTGFQQGLDSDIDGRDIQAWRATWAWDFLDNASIWVQYSKFEEDDRARITNQVCVRTDLLALGCEPNEVGYDAPHLGSTAGGLFFMLTGTSAL